MNMLTPGTGGDKLHFKRIDDDKYVYSFGDDKGAVTMWFNDDFKYITFKLSKCVLILLGVNSYEDLQKLPKEQELPMAPLRAKAEQFYQATFKRKNTL